MDSEIPLILILAVLLISGCVTFESNVNDILKSMPEVAEYMDAHPDANINISHWPNDTFQNVRINVSVSCDRDMPVKDYYRAGIGSGDEWFVVWLDSGNKTAECSYMETSQPCGTCEYFEDGECVNFKCCNDEDCYPNLVCVKNRCRKFPCESDSDCKDYQKCVGNECHLVLCGECQHIANHTCQELECCANRDCLENQKCVNDTCRDLVCGECQYIENHECEDYECCNDSMCQPGQKCISNRCVYYCPECCDDNCCGNGICENRTIIFNEGDTKEIVSGNITYDFTLYWIALSSGGLCGNVLVDNLPAFEALAGESYEKNGLNIYVDDVVFCAKGNGMSDCTYAIFTFGENVHSCPQDCGGLDVCGNGVCENQTIQICEGETKQILKAGMNHSVTLLWITPSSEGYYGKISIDGLPSFRAFEGENYEKNNLSIYVNDVAYSGKGDGMCPYISATFTFGENFNNCPKDCGIGANVSIPFESMYKHSGFGWGDNNLLTKSREFRFISYTIIRNNSRWEEVANVFGYNSSLFSDFEKYFLIMVFGEGRTPMQVEIKNITQHGNNAYIYFEIYEGCKEALSIGWEIVKIERGKMIQKENLNFTFIVNYNTPGVNFIKEVGSIESINI